MENVTAIQFIMILVIMNGIFGLIVLSLFFWMTLIEEKENKNKLRRRKQKLAERKIRNN